MSQGHSGPLSAPLGVRGPGREPPPQPEGAWLLASQDAVSGLLANKPVWEQSLLESQVAELNARPPSKQLEGRSGQGGLGGTVQGYTHTTPKAVRPALNLSLGSNGISEPQFAYL